MKTKFLFITLLALSIFSCNSSYKEFPGKIEFSGSVFYVINNSDMEFNNVRFTINDKFNGKGYALAPNDTAMFTIDTFSNSDGFKFDPQSMMVNSLYMACDNDENTYSMQYSK